MRKLLSLCCFGLFALALSGCEKDEIRKNKVPKPPPQPSGDLRLLAAVVSHPPENPKELVFVKLLGREDDVAKQVPAFDAFVKSLEIGDKIDWKTPEGWVKQRIEAGPFAPLASFTAGHGKIAPKVTVSRPGKMSGLLDNVNRWRTKDLGLAAIEEKELKTERFKAGKHEGHLVDMKGPGPKDPDDPPVRPPGKGPIEYKVPDGWRDTGPRGGFVPILASFSLAGGGDKDEVTVIQMGGDGGGLLGNINRWRGQVALPEVARAPAATELRVGGLKASRYDFAGPEKTMFMVLVSRDGRMWYFKLMAANAVAAKHKDAFDAFLKSVNFPGGKG